MKRRGEGERKGKDVSFRGGQILESKEDIKGEIETKMDCQHSDEEKNS
jgi:hypothetical protein